MLARAGPRLAMAFLTVSVLLPLVALMAAYEQRLTATRDAQIEALAIAEVLAEDLGQQLDGRPLAQTPELQHRLDALRRRIGGDVEIVDLRRNVVAHTMPDEVAQQLAQDPDGPIAATIGDGLARTTSGGLLRAPQMLAVVPIRTEDTAIAGAVVLDYTDVHHDMLAATAHIRRATVAAGLIGMVLALGLAYLMSRGLVRDIRQLTQTADQFAEGRYDARARTTSRGELRQLAAAFNTMADRIAARKQALIDLATTDTLTGLPNRRALRASLGRNLDQARRADTALALIILDLDRFKKINDEHGHLAGDAVLRQVAQVLQREIRPTDLAARLGGEEFAVVLPDTDRDTAVAIAERLRAAVASTPAAHQGEVLTVTTSAGVVAYPHDGQTTATLVKRADDALYSAKRAGRNRVHTPPST
ncbi:GGDEF domain-containing protein [Catellatospora tritici]|uniref:GGDEF domain-containing protein n=1 Tax=Catellatospora tritici TaxID=2851566 RepID=UPI001C2D23FB|nr:diguanylate cyclase [Catellatospora tritici]MBV1856677.1 diguanylate cyclase [Catellatospora tritici]